MSRRHADIWRHPGHNLVDPYTWPWSPNGHSHGHEWPTPTPFVQCQSALPFWDTVISKFDYENSWWRPHMWSKLRSHLTLKIQGQGHSQGETWWSHLSPRVQSICLLFILWQLDHFWLSCSKFHIWPSKFKVKAKDGNRPKSNQVIYRSGSTIMPKMKEIQKVVQKLSHGQKSQAGNGSTSGGSGVRTGTKT